MLALIVALRPAVSLIEDDDVFWPWGGEREARMETETVHTRVEKPAKRHVPNRSFMLIDSVSFCFLLFVCLFVQSMLGFYVCSLCKICPWRFVHILSGWFYEDVDNSAQCTHNLLVLVLYPKFVLLG